MSTLNLLSVFHASTHAEKTSGYHYYSTQHSNLESFAKVAHLPIDRVIAAFCALSPNNSEATNYLALGSCLAIVLGIVPPTAPVIAYNRDKDKALTLLTNFRVPIEQVLRGQKTYSFYRNTLDPDDKKFVTIDGHIYNAWCGQPRRLQSIGRELTQRQYFTIQRAIRKLSNQLDLTPSRFQSIIWLTWKRLHRILSSPQLQLESGYDQNRANRIIAQSPSCRLSCPSADGRSTEKVTSSSPVEQLVMEFGAAPEHTD